MLIDIIHQALGDHCIVSDLSVVPRGHVRIGTKLLYPDGDGIDLFVERGSFDDQTGARLSDFGQTMAKLAEFQVRMWQARSRMQMLEEAVADLGVRIEADALTMAVSGVEGIADAVLRLGQACIRASCMIFTKRASQQESFYEEVKSVVTNTGFPVKENYKFHGPYGVLVPVNFRVDSPETSSAVLTMFAANTASSHVQANEIYRKWSDLKDAGIRDKFLTVFEGRRNIEKQEDLRRIEKLSAVLPVTNPGAIQQYLRRAG
jgi:hypothetical protein